MSDNLLVLGDAAVHELLINLEKDEILGFQNELATCLAAFAVGEERKYQPEPGIINRPEGQKILLRPFTSPDSVGTKIIVDPAPVTTSDGEVRRPPLSGVLALCDNGGNPTGIINAKEVTGYRTSLSAMIPYMWRQDTENIVVFGAGKQALWHVRLALALRGSEIRSVTVVNRSLPRAQELVDQVKTENEQRWKSEAKLTCLASSQVEADKSLETLLTDASVIFCTVPSTSPLFPGSYLTEKVKKGGRAPLVSAIGSWQADMVELDSELVKYAVNTPYGEARGKIIVDDDQSVKSHAGEVVQNDLQDQDMVPLGALVKQQQNGQLSKHQSEWMAKGFVVYKSVGVGLTDLTAGNAILTLAKKKNVGTSVSDF